jgi:hypothetical protein
MASITEQPREKGLTLKSQRLAGSDHCLNCGTEMKGPFCYYCGQPDKRFLRFFPVMVREMFQDLFELDSRFTRTLKPLLFQPGKLTRDYIDGRRFRYTPPIRIYLFASVIFFLLATLATSLIELRVTTNEDGTETRHFGVLQMDDDTTRPDFQDSATVGNQEGSLADEEGLPDITLFGGEKWHPVDNPVNLPLVPARLDDWINRELVDSPNKAKAIEQNPKLIVQSMIDILPQVVFLLLPVFALVMKFFYLFAKRFYIEHLIFSLHNHSFIFVIFILVMLLNWMESGAAGLGWDTNSAEISFSVVNAVLMAWIPIYMFIAMKRVYQQGWFLTTVKYLAVGWIYIIVLGLTTGLAAAIGFLML